MSDSKEGREAVSIERCKACGKRSSSLVYCAREMMFGTGGAFEYVQCERCGCLQIRDVPSDLARFYPPDYSSFQTEPPRQGRSERFVRRLLSPSLLNDRGLASRVVTKLWCPAWHDWFKGKGLTLKSAILDVGTGAGDLLLALRACGFVNLSGVDAFIDADIEYSNGLVIRKGTLEDLKEKYDLVMLHHAFEHMPDPNVAFSAISHLVNDGGHVVLRTPVADSYAWEHYGVDWVALDAPRHLVIPTQASMRALAAAHGFEITRTVWDSEASQFWASEQYRRGIPLRDKSSYLVRGDSSLFSSAELAGFAEAAARLNREGRGDTCAFHLRLARSLES